MAQHHVIYIPGLFDRLNRRIGQATALALWRFSGIHPHYFLVKWADTDETYDQKLDRLLGRIDALTARGHIVSLVAASAGASLALVALHERPKTLNAVITIVGKIHKPETIPDAVVLVNPTYKISVDRAVKVQPHLPAKLRKKIMNVCPQSDHLVPIGETTLHGSKIEHLPINGHLMAIFGSLSIFRHQLIRFIREQAK